MSSSKITQTKRGNSSEKVSEKKSKLEVVEKDSSEEEEEKAPMISTQKVEVDDPYKDVPEYVPPKGRRPRVYVDGVFDLFHFGHALALKKAKETVPNCELVVGVTDDKTTWALKGMTVMNEKERAESVRHCKYADEVIECCPWYISLEFMDKHNLDFVAHGDDAQIYEGKDIYAFAKELGRFKVFPRTPSISTSDLILRIIKEYDVYVKRNLKRGYKRQDMNVSLFKESELMVKDKFETFGDFLKRFGGQAFHSLFDAQGNEPSKYC